MTRFERRLFHRTALLGAALTLVVVALDYNNNLNFLELKLDDQRAYYFQHFRPPPTNQLVFLDIDDTTLDVVGAWVWPRNKWASILHEIALAQPKAVGMDVMFPEPQDHPADSNGPAVTDDQQFADSIKEFGQNPNTGGVLLPVDIKITDPTVNWPLRNAMIDEYVSDLEVDDKDLADRVRARGFELPNLESQIAQNQSAAFEAAMFQRLDHELTAGHSMDIETLRAALLPHSAASGMRSDALNVLEKILPKVYSFHDLLRFTRPVQSGLPPLLSGSDESAPIPVLADAAQNSAFVNFYQTGDSKVRFIPLEMLDRSRVMPQFALALACATLGVDPKDLKLTRDTITIPRKNAPNIEIPVHTEQSPDYGGLGMVMDIPWWGGREWETMYDYPGYQHIKQHIPLTSVWDICEIGPEIIKNNTRAVNDLATINADDSYKTNHPPLDDAAAFAKLLNDNASQLGIDPNDYKPYLDGTKSIDQLTNPAEQALVLGYRTLTNEAKVDETLLQQREILRRYLRLRLQGKTVMIGWIASGNIDKQATPIHKECPGVLIHGAIFNAIMTHSFLAPAPKWIGLTLTAVACLLTGLASGRLHIVPSLVVAILISAILVFINFFVIYDWGRVEVHAAGCAIGPVVVWGACTIYRSWKERGEKKRIERRFSSYVDPNLVNYVLEHDDKDVFAGEDRELSVVFTDLQGFTAISELLKKDTVPLLNKYLGQMVPVVAKHRGLVNKFLGDGIMFFFGAPEIHPYGVDGHALAAVECILEMQQAMIPFNKELVERKLPTLKMRAGVSSGEVSVGDAGNPPARSDYTVLGDRVNFASRLESANKYTGTLVLISDRTVELLGNKYLVRPMGRLQVVGKKEPVMTFEPLAPIEKATDEMHKLVRMTQAMIDAYIASKFADCITLSNELLAVFGDTHAKFCHLYQHLCAQYLEHPPEDFLGQIILESK